MMLAIQDAVRRREISLSKIYLVVPAFNPGASVVDTVLEALPLVDYVILVDDGCTLAEKEYLQRCQAEDNVILLSHSENMGKGFALYTGMQWCLERMSSKDYILCIDSDGQHKASDIGKFRKLSEQCSDLQLALGERSDVSRMPWKSRVGNSISRAIFRLQYGGRVFDTQTGFRMLSRGFAALCVERIKPGRFETEMKMLILAVRNIKKIYSVEIETIYIEGNTNTKFNPLMDSWRIMRLFLAYVSVSVLSFILDYLLFIFLIKFVGMAYLLANVSARVVSAVFNFIAHKEYSFESSGGFFRKASKYCGAVVMALVMSSLLLYFSVDQLDVSEYLAKPVVDLFVYIFNFFVLSRFVFAEKKVDQQ